MLAKDFSELKYPRDGFGHALVELGEKNPDVVALSAGVSESVRTHWFGEKFPERFFQMGIAEQNMIGVACGLALAGKIPFASSFGSFSPARSIDQLRVSVAYGNVPVKLVATHCGLNVGPDGASAQMMEDIAMMRALPNFTVIAPCDYLETKKAVVEAAKFEGPVYIRVGREKVPTITTQNTPFEIGKAQVFREGSDVTIVACGSMVYESIKASEKLLHDYKLKAEILNVPTIKKIDSHAILKSVSKTEAVVSAEEHQVFGGLGSAVAEVLAKEYPAPMEMVAMMDRFGGSGNAPELMKEFGLTSEDIVKSVLKVLRRKG